MKIIKNIVISFIFLLLFVGCQEQSLDFTPLTIYDVKFEPKTVKAGDELTITYAYKDPSHYYHPSKVSVDNDGNLVYHKDSDIDDPVVDNGFVSFGVDCSDDDNFAISREDGHEYVEIRSKRTNIHPTKYTLFEDGKVKCIVPNNAKSGHVYLCTYPSLQYYGHSLEKLIVTNN